MRKNDTKYRKNSGFTLIELLAVIVILAIIALIATPIILGIVNDARKDAFERSVELLVSGTDIDIATRYYTNNYTYTLDNGIIKPQEIDSTMNVSIQNTDGMTGSVMYTDEGRVEYVIHNNKWCVVKLVDDDKGVLLDYNEDTCKGSYREGILMGADPVLKDNLVPVKISSTGEVTKADRKEEWYSYADKEWANAVILVGEDNYEIGAIIPENDIKQYYVWIPRYKYELWNVDSETRYPNTTDDNPGSESAIDIVFESRGTEISNGTENGEYLTHPAFTAFNTNGLWVGKFETSYDDAALADSSKFEKYPNIASAVATDIKNGVAGSKVLIKPNILSLTNINVSTIYQVGRAINSNLRSHMMKNMEWGAVAYLTYSEYGRCNETSCEEIYINNVEIAKDSTTITGCSADSASTSNTQTSCAIAWNAATNKASTTGNIYGIYDMSGGNYEYMMSVVTDESGIPYSGINNLYNSGFNGSFGSPRSDSGDASITSLNVGVDFPTADTAYYDTYYNGAVKTDNGKVYENGRLGDATKEIAPNNNSTDRGLWFHDGAYFATPVYPWFYRGGDCDDNGSGAGVMHFSHSAGEGAFSRTFRVVLAV